MRDSRTAAVMPRLPATVFTALAQPGRTSDQQSQRTATADKCRH
eukprot:CAMPEP_0204393128 /NCGR_PEP_ID=MMETSP0469-20131031/62150_1 /ASSEMBLY_ACC=CAM_ASM_000384 /TAXON_ID=2969 /ORGANISM="Oxyrrhis marina" /LENGTH=43 /DNA_ID= /DNA_START= /DNA_END= /DNA_ORIENTATION=